MRYISYELNEIKTKKEWLKWYEEYGDKSNFTSKEDWFNEMIKFDLLSKTS